MNHPVEPTTVPGLNESPSEKEGKFSEGGVLLVGDALASMKAPPKRKGNLLVTFRHGWRLRASMKAPPKRKGNRIRRWGWVLAGLRPQ